MGLKGYRLWAMGQLDSTCRAPPPWPPGAPPQCPSPTPTPPVWRAQSGRRDTTTKSRAFGLNSRPTQKLEVKQGGGARERRERRASSVPRLVDGFDEVRRALLRRDVRPCARHARHLRLRNRVGTFHVISQSIRVGNGLCGTVCVERFAWNGLCGASCVERFAWNGLCEIPPANTN
jgi:hypothetical protein